MRSISLFLILLLAAPICSARAAEPGIAPGKPAPQFELVDLTGAPLSPARFRGKVVLLNFWSTLCAPCVEEMPSLNRLYLSFKDRGFAVLSVAIDSREQPVRDFVAAKKIAFPVAVDREKEVFFDDYAGPSLPATYLIDGSGTIVRSFSGAREWDSAEMKSMIANMLGKR